MKKMLAIICSILMIVSVAGCSQENSYQKTEEELREEIKAEMIEEANQGIEEELREEIKVEMIEEANQKTKEVQISTSGDLILLNDDGSYRTLVEGSKGYQDMQSIAFLEKENIIVLMASYGSSPLGVYTYNLQEDLFTIVTESVKEYSIVDNTIKLSMTDDSIKYYDLNGYELDQPGLSVSTTPASEYEVNKEYRFDFEGKGTADTLLVDTDDLNHFDVIINGVKYSIDSDPQLVYFKYKLTEIGESGRYALTFFAAAPPHEEKIAFYEYTISSGLDKIGDIHTVYTEGIDLFNADINDLTYNSVNINNQENKFE